MKEEFIFEGKTVEEALENASKELEIKKEELKYEIIDEGSKGFLGVFSKKAKIKVFIDLKVNEVKEKINNLLENEFKIDVNEEIGTSVKNIPTEAPIISDDKKEKNINLDSEEVIKEVKKFIKEIFGFLDISVNIEVRKRKDNNVNLNIFTMGAQIPVSNLEDFILSLQFLVNKLSNVKLRSKLFFNIDINEFMAKKIDRLKNMAIEISKKVRKEGKSYTLKPMIASDRRIIHLTLKNNKFVKTESKGNGDKKRIIISPINSKKVS